MRHRVIVATTFAVLTILGSPACSSSNNSTSGGTTAATSAASHNAGCDATAKILGAFFSKVAAFKADGAAGIPPGLLALYSSTRDQLRAVADTETDSGIKAALQSLTAYFDKVSTSSTVDELKANISGSETNSAMAAMDKTCPTH